MQGDTEMPEAYQEGWIPFLGLKIYLDSRPLIPRPETEWWVEELIKEIQCGPPAEPINGALRAARPSLTPFIDSAIGPEEFASALEGRLGRRRPERQQFFSKKICVSREGAGELRALDLCAGSGAIGCALLKEFPTAHVSFGEIDPAHEATIRKNIRENSLDASRADIRIGDLFAPFAGEQFNLIVANPPYIPEDRELPASVADFEPALALRSGPDGLALMGRIAGQLSTHLAPGGVAWIECDSPSAEAASGLFSQAGFATQTRLDQYDRPRVIVISYP